MCEEDWKKTKTGSGKQKKATREGETFKRDGKP